MTTAVYLMLITVSVSYFHQSNAGTFSIDYNNHCFVKDGKPWQYISGSVHYFRIHPDLWEDRLKRVRALGFNAIQVYTAWVLHEPTPGNIDFASPGLNILRFFELAHQNELAVLLRPGPYICAESDYGMLPWWLVNIDGIKLRTYETNYINAVQRYYNRLLDEVKPLTYKNGGPIIMVQIENEYSALGVCDHNYTDWLRDFIWSKLGNDTVLYTTDPTDDSKIKCGIVPGALPTVDFGPTTENNIQNVFFGLQQKYANGGPQVVSEYWITGSPKWGETKPWGDDIPEIASNLHFIHSINGSSNVYMLYAGTNFGFINGQSGGIIATNYGVCPPIAENGDITPMFMAIRSMIQNLSNWENPPLDVPENNPVSNYGQVTMTRIGQNLISTLTQIQEPCVTSTYPLTFEQINHGFGYVLYTHVPKSAGTTLNIHYVRDFAYVFVNNIYKGMVGWNGADTLTINANQGDILRILVENGGRTNYWSGYLPNLEHAGLFNITLDGNWLTDWYQCGINLTESSITSLGNSFFEQNSIEETPEKAVSQPGVYIGTFNANVLQDTYFDSTGWGKGQLFVNGFNVGRYWPQAGPQIALYVPSPIIKPKNTVILIELTGAQQNYINFVNHTIYYYPNYNVNKWGCNLP